MASKNNITVNADLDLYEALELIEVSRSLFQKKLAEIKSKGEKTADNKKLELLEIQAQKLYEDYKKSLSAIEDYIDDISRVNSN